jgi:hypothetical protein
VLRCSVFRDKDILSSRSIGWVCCVTPINMSISREIRILEINYEVIRGQEMNQSYTLSYKSM